MKRCAFWVAILVMAFGVSIAQTTKSPYSGEEARDIKSLSPNEVTMYLHGAGMGLAKAAELNRYPGPMHVLELTSELELSDEQRAKTQKLLAETKTEARRIGKDIIALERELDRLFSTGKITEAELSRLVMEIGEKEAELRLVHLRAHVRQEAVLSAEQTSRYVALRGYGDGEEKHNDHGEKH